MQLAHKFSMSHANSLENNKQVFDNLGKQYDDISAMQAMTDLFVHSLLTFDVEKPRKLPGESELALTEDEIREMKRNLPFPNELKRKLINPETKIVDFACGTGLVMEKIAPYISHGEFIGVDISEPMLCAFNEKANKLRESFPDLEISSLCGDVLDPNFDTASLKKSADVLICTLAFHHLHDYESVAKKLQEFVKPGGWILIYDFYNEDKERPQLKNAMVGSVSRHGLTLSELSNCFSGCKNVSSAREFKVTLWQEKTFIMSHCCEEITGNLENLEKRGDLYSVDCSVVLGIAQV